MSAESDAQQTPPGTWNAGALHQHFSDRINDLQAQIDRRALADQRTADLGAATVKERIEALARLLDSEKEARDKAVSTALASIDKRDEANRDAVAARLDALSGRIDHLERFQQEGRGRAVGGDAAQQRLYVLGGLLFAGISIVVTVLLATHG